MKHNFPFSIIQGGMGVGTSSSRLANTVSRAGQLGVVSGTAVTHSLVRRLQLGDEDVKRAVEQFPYEDIAGLTLDRYFIQGGKDPQAKFKNPGMPGPKNCDLYQALTVLGSFVEVSMAKEGHSNPVGINLLHKIQSPHLPTLHGAMMAGVDYLLMGAGIPIDIPPTLNALLQHEETSYLIDTAKGSAQPKIQIDFHPETILGSQKVELHKPEFMPIIASKVLAMKFKRMENDIAGVIVESSKAGGHNAPPRNKVKYGEKDIVTTDELNKIGVSYFLAGDWGYHNSVTDAVAAGAKGVQVGSLFALCEESGFAPEYKHMLIEKMLEREAIGKQLRIDTSYRSSPTGYPFKEVPIEGSISTPLAYAEREDGNRICDMGYLREHKVTENGKIVSLCPSEPVDAYVKKGGLIEDTIGRKCICNHLMTTAGIGQIRKNGREELPIFTLGDAAPRATEIIRKFNPGGLSYSAANVLDYLQSN